MHPEFQKWGSMGPWFLKKGDQITKCEFDDISQLPTHQNLGLTEPQIWGIWPLLIPKIADTHNILLKSRKGHDVNASLFNASFINFLPNGNPFGKSYGPNFWESLPLQALKDSSIFDKILLTILEPVIRHVILSTRVLTLQI